MMGPGHRALGGACAAGVLIATDARLGVGPAALVVLAAVVTSGGTLSPDVDQARAWRRITGAGGARAHRCVTHWWPWPLLLWWWSGRLATAASALVFGSAIGWASHLLGDLLFGRSSPWRGAGVPTLTPRGPHLGLGLPVGGRLESWVTRALVAGCWLAVPVALVGEMHR